MTWNWPRGERKKLPTGLAFAIPAGFAGLVLPRSGLAYRLGIGIVNSPGLIDSGYRGEVSVVLVNLSGQTVRFARGDRIAQLMVVAVPAVSLEVVEHLGESERGRGRIRVLRLVKAGYTDRRPRK